MEQDKDQAHAIVLFDGICNYCNNWVNFIIRHDKKDRFRFAPLQSPQGQELLRAHHIPHENIDTFVLIEGDKHYFRSTAGLRVFKKLNGFFPLLSGFLVVPAFIRDVFYRYISRNRYKWYGRKESCMVPDARVKDKFLR
jgi:predicted DCC family thiol-disulfide oxidoreductase YuxK